MGAPPSQWGAPSISPMRGSARLPLVAGFSNGLLDFCFPAFGSPTGRTSLTSQIFSPPTSRTSRTSPRTKAEHSPLWGRWRGLKNINNFLTFSLSRRPQILARKGEGEPSSLLERRYNKAVGGFPYCVGRQNKEASRHNKETDGWDKAANEQKNEKKQFF